MWCFLFPLQFRRRLLLGGAFPSFFGVVLPFLVFSSFVFVSFFDHFSFLFHCCFLFFLFEGSENRFSTTEKGAISNKLFFSASQVFHFICKFSVWFSCSQLFSFFSCCHFFMFCFLCLLKKKVDSIFCIFLYFNLSCFSFLIHFLFFFMILPFAFMCSGQHHKTHRDFVSLKHLSLKKHNTIWKNQT